MLYVAMQNFKPWAMASWDTNQKHQTKQQNYSKW